MPPRPGFLLFRSVTEFTFWTFLMTARPFKIRLLTLCLALTMSVSSTSAHSAAAVANCAEPWSLYDRAKDLFQNRQFLLSSVHFSELSATRCDAALSDRALFSYSLSVSELGDAPEAIRSLTQLLNRQPHDPALARTAALYRAYLSPEYLPSLPDADRSLLNAWTSRKESEDFLKQPSKTPWVAALASAALPGAGQTYVGNYQSAAVAFVLNALFLGTTIELVQKKLPVSATAAGMVFSVTYLGNILNATDGARKYNEGARQAAEQKLRSKLFPDFQP
jgi:hypothetical protein